MQQMIVGKGADFEKRSNELLAAGWRIVPGTLVVAPARLYPEVSYFAAVFEASSDKPATPYSPLPTGRKTTPIVG